MSKIWVLVFLLLCCVGVLVIAKVYPPAEVALTDGFNGLIAMLTNAHANFGAMLMAIPFYAQYVVYLIGTLMFFVGIVFAMVVWPRRPHIIKHVTTSSSTKPFTPQTAPVPPEPAPQPYKTVEPEKKEEKPVEQIPA